VSIAPSMGRQCTWNYNELMSGSDPSALRLALIIFSAVALPGAEVLTPEMLLTSRRQHSRPGVGRLVLQLRAADPYSPR
jgi:hypothetical protein